MARQHYFYNVMRKTIIQFLDVFNDIVIARYNQDTGAITKYVSVPLKFAPKTKQWYWTELREAEDRRDQVFPMMSCDLESVDYAVDRQVNRNHKIFSYKDSEVGKQYFNPVPYDFSFSLKIASEYMVDITQIVEQIFPFFTPEAYIRITIPELSIDGLAENGEEGAEKLELRVVYDGSTKESPIELDENGYRILIWTLNFKVQGYLFSPIYETKPIHHVVQSYYLSQQAFENQDSDGVLGELDSASLQGNTLPQEIPAQGIPIDDTIKELWDYEHISIEDEPL